MAKPIKETPVLYGEQSRRFTEKVRANENKKLSATEYKKALADYKELKKLKVF